VNDLPRALLSQPLIESGKEIAAHFGVSWHHSYQVMSKRGLLIGNEGSSAVATRLDGF